MNEQQSDHDKNIDKWLRKHPLQPRQGFADETYERAITAGAENRKIITFPLQLAAAAIVIAMLTTLSHWQNDTYLDTSNPLYTNLDYIEMEELLLLENMLEPLTLDGTQKYPEYYW